MIDFALANERTPTVSDEDWDKQCLGDLADIYRHALWTQSGLGAQPDQLGRDSQEYGSDCLAGNYQKCMQKIALHSML